MAIDEKHLKIRLIQVHITKRASNKDMKIHFWIVHTLARARRRFARASKG